VEVVDELIAQFWKLEEWCSRFKCSGMRIRNLLLGWPSDQARLADNLNEAIRPPRTELVAWREEDPKLEALWTSVVQVQDMMLDRADGPSSFAASLSTAVELLEG
jgi:hypothetical protein